MKHTATNAKALGVLLLSVVAISVGVAFKVNPYGDAPFSTPHKLQQLKQEIQFNDRHVREAETTIELARALRNHAHAVTKVGPGSEPVPFTPAKYENIKSGKTPLLCNGMASLYVALAQLHGIPARLVYLATNEAVSGAAPNDVHTAAEVSIDGKWIIEDPTFNVEWHLDNTPLGIEALRRVIRRQEGLPSATTNDFKVTPSRSLQNYYLDYKKLLANIEIANADPLASGSTSTVVALGSRDRPFRYYQRQGKVVSSTNLKSPEPLLFFESGDLTWTPSKGLRIASLGGSTQDSSSLTLTTPPSNYRMELISPELELQPGKYTFVLVGKIEQGGLTFGLLDTTKKTWLKSANFWDGQFAGQTRELGLVLTAEITNKQTVNLVLSNWSLENASSKWSLKQVLIVGP